MNFFKICLVISILILTNNITYISADENNVEQEVKQLTLDGVKVTGKKSIELKFGADIDDEKEKDLIIRTVGDDVKEIFISDFEVYNNKLTLILDEELESNQKYEIIIFSITGTDSSIITSGLDGAINFLTGELSVFDAIEEPIEEKPVVVEEEKIEEPTIIEDELIVEEEKIEEKIEEDELPELNSAVVAESESNTEELPTTGPEQILLLLLSLILAGLIGNTFKGKKIM